MVSNYDIILKQKNLTDLEYKQIYNNLIKNDSIYIPFDKNLIDKSIRRIKYLSKTYYFLFIRCPRKFELMRIKGIYNTQEMYSLGGLYGRNAHFGFDKVWDNINFKRLIKFNTTEKIRNYIYIKCTDLISKLEKNLKLYKFLFLNYANYETFRITHIFNRIGAEKSKKYIIPEYRELKIENHIRNEVGVIDVIHRLLDDSGAIGDYKTGKPKYYELEWNPNREQLDPNKINYDKDNIKTELSFYYNLINSFSDVYKVINIDGINILKDLEFLNIKKGFIVYIKDWYNTFKYINIKETINSKLDNVKSDIIDGINKGYFPMKFRSDCFDYCEYAHICVKDKEFTDNFKQIHPFYLEKLKNLEKFI